MIADGAKQSGCGDGTGGGCYAERMAGRFCGPGGAYEGLVRITANGPRWTGVVRLIPEHLADPLRWRKPRRIFVNSMSDLFHESLDDGTIDMVVAVMMICALHETRGGHTFQTLTKRAARMRSYFTDPGTQDRVARAAARMMEDGDGWYDEIAFRKEGLAHPLLWFGVSVENQAAADERIPELLATPAAVRFLSCEPLIGPVHLPVVHVFGSTPRPPGIDWVIAGCESGPGARPCSVEWLRSLRDQCAAAGVPFFLKQASADRDPLRSKCPECGKQIRWYVHGPMHSSASCACTAEGAEDASWHPSIGLGDGSKRKSGGVIELPYLDGVQHAAFPEVPR